MSEIEKTFSKLRNLRQYKDKTDEEVMIIAKEQYEREDILGQLNFCINDEERDFAKNLLSRYLSEASLESFSDKDTLRQLIDIEIMVERLKKTMNDDYNKVNPYINEKTLDTLQNLNKQIIQLKEILGFINKNKNEGNLSERLEILKRKAINYYNESAGCNLVRCPYCQEHFMLLMDARNLEAKKQKWFKRTLLYNKSLYDMYHNKELTTEKMADIFGVSTFYIEYIYETVYLPEIESNVNDRKD